MRFVATVVRVMIASPFDVPEARDAVEKAVYGWNDANAAGKGEILQPWRWETSAVPVLGGHPQALINAQGLDNVDVVIALFGSHAWDRRRPMLYPAQLRRSARLRTAAKPSTYISLPLRSLTT